MTSLYEETYARLWKAQVEQDKQDNPSFRSPTPQELNGRNTGKFGVQGGRIKAQLSDHAKKINRMMGLGMIQSDIAQVMGTSQQSISQTQTRYGLPRSEDHN